LAGEAGVATDGYFLQKMVVGEEASSWKAEEVEVFWVEAGGFWEAPDGVGEEEEAGP